MKYYIINNTFLHEGVSTFQIRSFLTQEKLNILKNNLNLIKEVYSEDSKVEVIDSFNNTIAIDIKDIISIINDAKEISEEEIEVLEKYPVLSIDIITEFADDLLIRGLDFKEDSEKYSRITDIYLKIIN